MEDARHNVRQGVETGVHNVRQGVETGMDEIRKRYHDIQDMGVSVRDMVMEFIGTSLFVLVGLLVVVYAQQETPLSDPVVSSFVVAFTFGIAITVMVYATMHTSGGQLNPAITAGCMAAGVTSPIQAAANIIAQCSGTILSAVLLMILVPQELRDAAANGVNSVPEGSTITRAFLAEAIGMFMIVLTVLESATHYKSQALNCAPIAIGLSFVVCILAFGPVSSGSFNPARSLGPAVMSGNLKHLWIYILAPLLGGALAAPVHLMSLSGWDSRKQKKRAEGPGPSDPNYVPAALHEALLPSSAE